MTAARMTRCSGTAGSVDISTRHSRGPASDMHRRNLLAFSTFPADDKASVTAKQNSEAEQLLPPVPSKPQAGSIGLAVLAILIVLLFWMALTVGLIVFLPFLLATYVGDTRSWALLGASLTVYAFLVAPILWTWASGRGSQNRTTRRSWFLVKWFFVVSALFACAAVGISLFLPARGG